jgi:hypothetical protein
VWMKKDQRNKKETNKQIQRLFLLIPINWTNQVSFNMYTFNITKTSRCTLCYALLSPNTNTTNSTIGYSSSTNRRHGYRCSISSIERLISSSRKFQKLWHKNENEIFNHRSICYRCCDTIGQIEQIKNHIEQLNNEQQVLMHKIEHNLFKRAQILQGQRQRMNHIIPFSFNHQVISFIFLSFIQFLFC